MEDWFQIIVQDEDDTYCIDYWKSGNYYYKCVFNDEKILLKKRIGAEEYLTAKYDT